MKILSKRRSTEHRSGLKFAGLPMRNLVAERFRLDDQPTLISRFQRLRWPTEQAAQVTGWMFLNSDFGPTSWTGADEMRNWFNLERYLEDEALASHELMRIAGSRDYCTPGVLPFLCESLRRSWQARMDALNRVDFRRLERSDSGYRHMWRLMSKTRQLHRRRDLIGFPWNYPADFLDHQARDIFRVLTRETLLRHVLFLGTDNQIHRGEELALDTRLVVSSVPALIPALPLFLNIPLDLDPDFELGDGEDIPLAKVNLPDSPAQLRVTLRSRGRIAETLKIAFAFPENFEPTERQIDELELSAQAAAEGAMTQFLRLTGTRARPRVTTNWDGERVLLRLTGLRPEHQILYAYFLAHRQP